MSRLCAYRRDHEILNSSLTLHLLHQEQNGLEERERGMGNDGKVEEWNGLELWRAPRPFCSWVGRRKRTECHGSRLFCSWRATEKASEAAMRSCRAKARFVSVDAAKTEGLRGARWLSRRPGERMASEVATWGTAEAFGRRAAEPNAIARDARFAAPTGSWSRR